MVFFLLMQATDRWESYARYLPMLFALNLAVALVLVAAILAILWRLAARLREGLARPHPHGRAASEERA